MTSIAIKLNKATHVTLKTVIGFILIGTLPLRDTAQTQNTATVWVKNNPV